MLGSMSTEKTLSTANLTGEYLDCDLCEEMQFCTERSGIVACQDCQREHLPRESGL